MTGMLEARRLVLIMTLGLCEAIEKNAISIAEAERYLFAPRTIRIFENDPEIEKIIDIASEFDALRRLMPAELGPAIADVKRRALDALASMSARMPGCEFGDPAWLGALLQIKEVEMNRSGASSDARRVYLLSHYGELEDGSEHVKLIGIYSSEEKAAAAKLRAQSKPGFAQAPDKFIISTYDIDRDYWSEGFLPLASE